MDLPDPTQQIWWHGGRAPLDAIDWHHPVNGGLHLGTLAQARHRGRFLSAFRVRPGSTFLRTRDEHDGWAKKARRWKRSAEGAIYLNRTEGIQDLSIDWGRVDRLSDEAFAKAVPEAAFSLCVWRPHALVGLSTEEAQAALTDLMEPA